MSLDFLEELLEAKKNPAVDEVIDAAKERDFDEFINLFDEAYGSSATVWMNNEDVEELMTIISEGGELKSFSADISTMAKENFFKGRVKKWIAAHPGWEHFAEEENGSSMEIIVVRKNS